MNKRLTKDQAVNIGRKYKERLQEIGIPIERVLLFGSVALDASRSESDIDIAIVGPAFRRTRLEEAIVCRKATWDIDTRIEPICLRPGDMENRYFSLGAEIRKNGVEL